MTLEQLLYLIPYVISAALSLGVAYYAWRRRSTAGAAAFALYALAEGIATLGYLFETASGTLTAKMLWDDLQWPSFFIFPIAALIFVQQYGGQTGKRTVWVWRVLGVICVAFALFTVTGSLHGLTRVDPQLIAGEPFSILQYDLPTVILAITLIPYLMFVYVVVNLFLQVLRKSRVYRSQAITIFLGLFIPFAGLTATLVGVSFGGQRDISPILFAMGNFVIAWGLFRYKLFNLVPVARETVLENLRDAVIVVDLQNRVVDVNPAARHIVGGVGSGVIGADVAKVFQKWSGIVQQYLDAERADTEIKIESQNGAGNSYYNLSISPLRDKQNKTQGRLIQLRDITESVEARLQIEQAKHAAEEANETKSRFLANMSHELRTPLNAILNFTAFVADGVLGPVTEEQAEVLNQSLGSGKHLLSLINDVLDITKIEAGMMQLFIQEVDFNEALQGTISVAKGLIKEKSINLITDVEENLPKSFGDKRRLRQVFLNLMSNAIKFTQSGSVTIEAKRSGDGILVRVADTGIGIAPEDHELVFESFRQVNKHEMVEAIAGTGLGMPISKYFVESHGGKIWFESEPGVGTTFYVELPVLTREEAAAFNVMPETVKA